MDLSNATATWCLADGDDNIVFEVQSPNYLNVANDMTTGVLHLRLPPEQTFDAPAGTFTDYWTVVSSDGVVSTMLQGPVETLRVP